MAQIPTYYVMERDKGMARDRGALHAVGGLDRDVQVADRGRGGGVRVPNTAGPSSPAHLQGYRVRRGSDPREHRRDAYRFRAVPSMCHRCSSRGKSDWGVYQTPGAVDKMRTTACTRMVGFHLLDGAGHWVQQEQPEQVSTLLIQFLRDQRRS